MEKFYVGTGLVPVLTLKRDSHPPPKAGRDTYDNFLSRIKTGEILSQHPLQAEPTFICFSRISVLFELMRFWGRNFLS